VSEDQQRCQQPDRSRDVYARGWCGMHYKRWLRTGSPVRGERAVSCAVEGCDRQAKSRGWCHAHYQRWRTHGDVRADLPLRAAGECDAEGCDRPRHARQWCSTHYRRALARGHPDGTVPMARHLQRPLREDEVVHHINGNRTDNRLENLELWSTAHPKGQRVEDKVRFAVELLRKHAPAYLAADEDRDEPTEAPDAETLDDGTTEGPR
jgi:hypothetical protein